MIRTDGYRSPDQPLQRRKLVRVDVGRDDARARERTDAGREALLRERAVWRVPNKSV